MRKRVVRGLIAVVGMSMFALSAVIAVAVGLWFLSVVTPAREQVNAVGGVWTIVFGIIAFIIVPLLLLSFLVGLISDVGTQKHVRKTEWRTGQRWTADD